MSRLQRLWVSPLTWALMLVVCAYFVAAVVAAAFEKVVQ
jgi:hypothetical protein